MGGRTPVGSGDKIARTLRALGPLFEAHPGAVMVIGGIAVNAHGVTRTTRDIDLTVSGDQIELPALLDELEAAGFETRIPNALAFAAEAHVLLLRHRETGIELDVSRGWTTVEAAHGSGQADRSRETLKISRVTLPTIDPDRQPSWQRQRAVRKVSV